MADPPLPDPEPITPPVLIDGAFDLLTGWSVTRDRAPVTVTRSQGIARHTDSFQWGYIGSGAAQLAVELMLEAGATDIEANEFQGRLRRELVAKWPASGGFSITVDELKAFLTVYRVQKALE